MDKYSVKLMSRALRDLDGIYDYIARTLLEPETAINLVNLTIRDDFLFGAVMAEDQGPGVRKSSGYLCDFYL